jgi:hypothetical protein
LFWLAGLVRLRGQLPELGQRLKLRKLRQLRLLTWLSRPLSHMPRLRPRHKPRLLPEVQKQLLRRLLEMLKQLPR